MLEAIALAERFMLRGRERQRRARLSRRDRVIATLHSSACLNATAYDENQAFQMPTDGRMKYIWRPHSGAEQLFDLTTDPKEYINLAAEPDRATEVARWRDRMIAQLQNRPEGFVSEGKLVAGQPYPDLVPAD
ncbi:MAG: hypothetical protein R3F03_00305 [Opitutaceae bacterium]